MNTYKIEVIKFAGKKMFCFEGVRIFQEQWNFDLLEMMKATLKIWRKGKLYDQAEWLSKDEGKYKDKKQVYAFRGFERKTFDRYAHGEIFLYMRSLKVGDVIEIEVEGEVDWLGGHYLHMMKHSAGGYGELLQNLYPLTDIDHWENNIDAYHKQYEKRIDELKRMLKDGVIEYVNYPRYKYQKSKKGKKRVQVLNIVERDEKKYFELQGYLFNKMDVFYGLQTWLDLEVYRAGKKLGTIFHYEVGTHAAILLYQLFKEIGSDDYMSNFVPEIWADRFEVGDVINFVTEEPFDLLKKIVSNFIHGENPEVVKVRRDYPTYKEFSEKLKAVSYLIRNEIESTIWGAMFKRLRAMVLTKKIPVMDFNKE